MFRATLGLRGKLKEHFASTSVVTTESNRIADQLRRAFKGEAWLGPSLLDLLAEITPEQARARPLAAGHNIWELVMHIDFWVQAAAGAMQGVNMPTLDGPQDQAPGDWAVVKDLDAVAWFDAQDSLFQNAERLAQSVELFSERRLNDIVPGRPYDFYHLFHGIVQHSIYHAGQIAILKKAVSGA